MGTNALGQLMQTFSRLDDGVHVFSLKGGRALSTNGPSPKAPLLTASGEPEEIRRLVDCFSGWKGEVKLAALQDEGLLDLWVY